MSQKSFEFSVAALFADFSTLNGFQNMNLSTSRSLFKLFRQEIVLHSAKTSGSAFSSASQNFCKTPEAPSDNYKKVFQFPHITKIAAFTKIKVSTKCDKKILFQNF